MNTSIATVLFLAAVLVVPVRPANALGMPFASAGPDAALITGRLGKPGSDLYPVQFVEINGRNVAGDRDYIWLKPGRYTIKVRMLITDPPGPDFRRPEHTYVNGYNEIELDLEAGKTYTILARFDKTRDRAPYQTILYKVSANE